MLGVEKAKIYDENEFVSVVKAEYEKELILQKEKEAALEQEEDGLMLHLKRRFMEKKNFEDYPLAVELFESLNPQLNEKTTAELV